MPQKPQNGGFPGLPKFRQNEGFGRERAQPPIPPPARRPHRAGIPPIVVYHAVFRPPAGTPTPKPPKNGVSRFFKNGFFLAPHPHPPTPPRPPHPPTHLVVLRTRGWDPAPCRISTKWVGGWGGRGGWGGGGGAKKWQFLKTRKNLFFWYFGGWRPFRGSKYRTVRNNGQDSGPWGPPNRGLAGLGGLFPTKTPILPALRKTRETPILGVLRGRGPCRGVTMRHDMRQGAGSHPRVGRATKWVGGWGAGSFPGQNPHSAGTSEVPGSPRFGGLVGLCAPC